jgi:hypothetical protein
LDFPVFGYLKNPKPKPRIPNNNSVIQEKRKSEIQTKTKLFLL